MPRPKLKIPKRLKTPLIRRIRIPILLVLISLTIWVAAAYGVWPDRWRPALMILAKFLTIIAIGWTATALVDLSIKRRLRKLELGVANNLEARKLATRLDVLRRVWMVIGAIATLACALVVVPWARQLGVSLLASAGIVGIAVGLAARPVLSNLIAGLQIAFTQPIRIDDAVVVEGEWGWIEEIGLFYVVIKIWDWRRLVVPLSYFTERPFQNWTRQSGSILGSTFWHLDYRAPVKEMRKKLEEICKGTDLWDGNITNLQVSESNRDSIEVRALASASTSPRAWDLRCHIREEMIHWLQSEYPEALPRQRASAELSGLSEAGRSSAAYEPAS